MVLGYLSEQLSVDISRKEGTGNREQGEVIDNFWIRIDSIFNFWRCLVAFLHESSNIAAALAAHILIDTRKLLLLLSNR